MTKALEQRWSDMWERLGAQQNAVEPYADLAARYREPTRAYHTLEHIRHCLDEFDHTRHLALNADAVELALWYHDAVYNAQTTDNEERSAALATEMTKRASLPDELSESVANLIMATKHKSVPADPDGQLVVDIDLSILGQEERKFDEYERQIRLEYEWVPQDAYVAGRSTILQSFLDRPHIYATRFFREKYEAQGRANIARSLALLSA